MDKLARLTRVESGSGPALLTRASRWLDRWFPLLLVVGALLLLCLRLDDVYLWQDEAETALIARHMLAYGLPLSTDGRTWVQQEEAPFREFTTDYVWVYHPWLQYAVTALSFAILGANTISARLPFALAGLASVLLLYRLALTLQPRPGLARLAAVLLAVCIPSILLARQCRYYAISAAMTLLVLNSYFSLESGSQWSLPSFVLTSVLLFHTEYAAFFPLMLALTAHSLLFRRSGQWKKLLRALALIAALTLPWTTLIPVWHPVAGTGAVAQLDAGAKLARTLARTVGLVGAQGLQITAWFVPLLLIPTIVAGVTANRRMRSDSTQYSHGWSLLLLVIAAHVLSLSLVGWSFFRYLANIIALLVLLCAVGLMWLLDHWRPVGYVALALLLTTNALQILPYRAVTLLIPSEQAFWQNVQKSPATRWLDGIRTLNLRSDLLMYTQELTHEYSGPTEGLVAYLSKHGSPGQSILANYEDLPLQFYTDLTVYGGMSGRGLTEGIEPDWIVDRQYGHYRDQIAALVASGEYERITLPYPDIRWENREEPGKHQYLTDMTANPVVLYRRMADREGPGK